VYESTLVVDFSFCAIYVAIAGGICLSIKKLVQWLCDRRIEAKIDFNYQQKMKWVRKKEMHDYIRYFSCKIYFKNDMYSHLFALD